MFDVKMFDGIIEKWLDFGEMLDKKFKYGKKIFEVITIAIAVLFFIVAGGWLIAYDTMTLDDDGWVKSDSIMCYSGMMFVTVCLGTVIEAFILICIFGLLAACIYGWFIMLPLIVVFLGICFGRWLVVRKRRKLQ